MRKQFGAFPSLLDVGRMYGMTPESVDYAEKIYRIWCESAGEIQDRAAQFLNNRLANDSAAIAQLGQCRTPVEVFNAQVDYATKAFSDFVDEGQKVAAYLDTMTSEAMRQGPQHSAPKSKEAAKGKRPAHRVVGH